MAVTLPELNARPGARRWSCVLDPALALSRPGLVLARQVRELVEFWLVRELLHILDSSEFYVQHPELLMAGQPAVQKLKRAIREWERMRMESDLAGLRLYWIGDGLAESVLPEGADARLLPSYESLACALDRRIGSVGPMTSATRDAAALAAALGTAFVLSFSRRDDDQHMLPPICNSLQGWNIPAEQIAPADPAAAIESEHLRHVLVHAGLSHLMWADVRLAVVRLLLPNAPLSFPGPADEPAVVGAVADDDESSADPWVAAQAFWHLI
jgi:hypothetical protein